MVHREFRRWSMTVPEIPKVKSLLVDPGHKRHPNGGNRCYDQSDHGRGLLRTPCFRERLGQRTKLLGTLMNHQGHAGGPAGLQPGVWPRRQGCSHHAPVNIFRDVNEKTESLGQRWRSWSVNGERWVTHRARRVPRHRHTGQLSNCRRPEHGSGVHFTCRRDLPAPTAAHFSHTSSAKPREHRKTSPIDAAAGIRKGSGMLANLRAQMRDGTKLGGAFNSKKRCLQGRRCPQWAAHRTSTSATGHATLAPVRLLIHRCLKVRTSPLHPHGKTHLLAWSRGGHSPGAKGCTTASTLSLDVAVDARSPFLAILRERLSRSS